LSYQADTYGIREKNPKKPHSEYDIKGAKGAMRPAQ
jgi:hypothetical protein